MKKSITFIVGLLLLALFNPGIAQTWTQAGPYAGNITGIASTTTLLFAGAKNEYSSGGAWTSADNGQTWNNVIDNIPGKIIQTVGSLGDVLFVAAQAHQDNTGTTYTDGGIYRSADNGITWTQPWAASASVIINCLYSTGTTIFATTPTGPYRSVDGGVIWTLARTGLNTGQQRAGKCFLTCGDTLFMGTRAGVYRSVNNGTNWIASTAGIPLSTGTFGGGWITGLTKFGSTLYASTLEQGMFRSTDNGINWVAANNGLPELNLRSVYASGYAIFTSTKMNGVFKSTDNGASWVQSTLGLPSMEICCFLQSGTKLLAGGFDGIYQTIDNGLNWSSTNNNLAGHLIKPMIKAGNYLFTGSYSGRVYRSADEGASWQQANGTMRSPGSSLGSVYSLGCVGSTIFVSLYDSMYRSTNWGDTWTGITSVNIQGTTMQDMKALNSRIFAANGNLLYSDDAGITWYNDPDLTAASRLCIKGGDVFVSAGITVSRSVSGTGPFTLMGSLPASVGGIMCMAELEGKLYAGTGQAYTGQGVFKSDDNGVTWIQAGLSDSLVYELTVVSGKLFAKTKYSVMQKNTTDDSWVKVSLGLPFNFMGAGGSALLGNNETLYVGVSARSLYKADVSQFNPPLQPGVISGPATPCIGSTQTYSITNVPDVTYAWQFPSGWVVTAGITTNSVTVTVGSTSGAVLVIASNLYGSGPAQALAVTPVTAINPSISISANPSNIVYTGTQVTYTAIAINGGTTPSYQWYINGIADITYGQGQTYSYIPMDGDQIKCELTPVELCVIPSVATSNVITMQVSVIPIPVAFEVTGGGSYCQGGTGLPVGLSNSETGVIYTLIKNGVAQVPTVAGTGSAITFGIQLNGTYTVTGTYITVSNTMIGSAVITELPTVNVSVAISSNVSTVCTGSTVGFTAIPVGGGTAPTYQWYVNSLVVTTGETFSYIPVNGDVVYVEMTSNVPCAEGNPAVSNSITMEVNQFVTSSVSIMASQNNVCEGTSITCTANPVNGGTSPEYQWYKNGVAIATGATYIDVHENNDVIYSIMTSNAACLTNATATSNSITMVINPKPAAAGLINGIAEICAGTTQLEYSVAEITNASSYEWTIPLGVTITNGSGTNTITVDYSMAALSGIMQVYGVNSCGNGIASPTYTVTVNAIPVTPVISQTGSTLYSTAPTGNQWYKDGIQIPGATQATYNVTADGTYYSIVTVNSCSSGLSNSIFVLFTGSANAEKIQIELYPVPNNGLFDVMITCPSNDQFDIRIYTNTGSLVYELKDLQVNGTIKQHIDMQSMPSGTYIMTFTSTDKQVIRKLVINK